MIELVAILSILTYLIFDFQQTVQFVGPNGQMMTGVVNVQPITPAGQIQPTQVAAAAQNIPQVTPGAVATPMIGVYVVLNICLFLDCQSPTVISSYCRLQISSICLTILVSFVFSLLSVITMLCPNLDKKYCK